MLKVRRLQLPICSLVIVVCGSFLHDTRAADVALKDGDVVRLKCLGDSPKSAARWLMGNTKTGDVALVKEKNSRGTRWAVHRDDRGDLCLRCKDGRKGQLLYIDGNTVANDVALKKNVKDYTGTHWQVRTDGNTIHLKCEGHIEGPRWLYGHTESGVVDMSKDGKATGARWEVDKE